MSRSDEDRLPDILDACALVTRLVGRGRVAFDSDEAIGPALERELEVVGESAQRLSLHATDMIPGVPWDDIRRVRIVLAHHYHRVDREQVWRMANHDLPALARAINRARPGLAERATR